MIRKERKSEVYLQKLKKELNFKDIFVLKIREHFGINLRFKIVRVVIDDTERV